MRHPPTAAPNRSLVRVVMLSAAALGVLSPDAADAHSVKQKVGAYSGSDGAARQRLSLDLAHEREASTVNLSVTRDAYQIADIEADESKYARDIYGDDHWDNQAATVTWTQTWERLTETRVMGVQHGRTHKVALVGDRCESVD